MSQHIDILLVDDHTLFRESLSRLLQAESDFRVMGSCGSVAAAIEILRRERVDIVLLDYNLGEKQGPPILKTKCPVLLIAGGISGASAVRMMGSGSSGIFLKSGPPKQLIDAIRAVTSGELWIDPVVLRTVIARSSGNLEEEPPALAPPTPREQAVLKALIEGLTNKEIAASIGIPELAVKWAVQQLLKKAGVRRRSELVRLALEKPDWAARCQ